MLEHVHRRRFFGLHISVAAFIPVHLVASEVSLRRQMQRLSPESVSLAMREREYILCARDSMESILFRHCLIAQI